MFRLDEGLKVYLHREAVDFRKYINGLATLLATLPKARRADDYEALLPWRLTPRAQSCIQVPVAHQEAGLLARLRYWHALRVFHSGTLS